MAEKEQPSESSAKHFFSTLPGIITAIAGLITAIGGFLLILNKTGCMTPKNTAETAIEKQVEEDDQAKETDETNSEKTETNSGLNGVSYSPSQINLLIKNVVFKITSAKVQQLPNKEIFLTVKIKCDNNSKYEYHFYANILRIKINDEKYASEPSSPSGGYESVPANSFKNLEYNYRLPGATKNFNLTVYDEKEEMGSSAFTVKQ